MGDGGNAKIGEQHLLVLPDQHILRLDITMDKLLFVRILQGCSHLLDRGDDHRKRNQAAFWIAMPQRAIRGIVDHQKGHAFLHIKIEHTYDRGMSECGDGLGFLLEVFRLQRRSDGHAAP